MPDAQWTFWRPSRGAPRQDPTHTEHFTQDELEGLTETLAREALQNSLDEPVTADGSVHVRFAFSGTEHALPPERASAYLQTLVPHLRAAGISFSAREPVPYLLIEDFGTRGLVGDPAQSADDPDAPGNFYYFWRNIGRTNKRAAEGGTWGLGKAVYPAVSSIRTFLGLSIRDDSPRRVLMGHSLLITHGSYSPYGWYGHTDGDDFVLPVTSDADLREFAADFRLKRTNETGLSLAILKPEPELTPEAIAAGVIRQYFLALVSGRLTVAIEFPGGRYDINRGSVDRLAGSLPVGASVSSWLSLARAATNPGIVIPVVNSRPDGAPKWENCQIAHDDPHELRRRFERGEVLAFSVPVIVRRSGAWPADSSMRVYLVKDASGKRERPLFVRGGISIPKATEDRLAGVRALGVTDGPLAGFVRDSENPSHTEWRRDSTHFRGRYDLGPSTLTFVKQAPAQLWSRLAETEEERDPYSLADLFHVPEPLEEPASFTRSAEEPAAHDEEPPKIPRAVAQPIHIRRADGGFVIAANPNAESFPESIELRAAYMVRDGARQALARYSPLDFRLERMQVDVQGATVDECDGNKLILSGVTRHMRVEASGFDTLRDIVIRVVPVEEEEAANAAKA